MKRLQRALDAPEYVGIEFINDINSNSDIKQIDKKEKLILLNDLNSKELSIFENLIENYYELQKKEDILIMKYEISIKGDNFTMILSVIEKV